jgi:hypothetical protein
VGGAPSRDGRRPARKTPGPRGIGLQPLICPPRRPAAGGAYSTLRRVTIASARALHDGGEDGITTRTSAGTGRAVSQIYGAKAPIIGGQ